jgi:hypothetical protein
MATMTPADVRDILEGYCLDTTTNIAKTGAIEDGSVTVTIADVSDLKLYMKASGVGVPAGAIVASIGTGTIELSIPATVTNATAALTFTQYDQVSDAFIANVRDRKVLPYVEEKVGFSLSGTTGRTTEFRSGTGSSIIILAHRPIVEVKAITLVTNPSNWIYVSPTAVEVIADEGILKLRAVLEAWTSYVPAFPRGKDNIKVDYVYGYASAPDDLVDAVNSLTAAFVLGHVGARTGGGSVNVPGIGRSYGARGKYEDIRRELERYAYAAIRKYTSSVVGS